MEILKKKSPSEKEQAGKGQASEHPEERRWRVQGLERHLKALRAVL